MGACHKKPKNNQKSLPNKKNSNIQLPNINLAASSNPEQLSIKLKSKEIEIFLKNGFDIKHIKPDLNNYSTHFLDETIDILFTEIFRINIENNKSLTSLSGNKRYYYTFNYEKESYLSKSILLTLVETYHVINVVLDGQYQINEKWWEKPFSENKDNDHNFGMITKKYIENSLKIKEICENFIGDYNTKIEIKQLKEEENVEEEKENIVEFTFENKVLSEKLKANEIILNEKSDKLSDGNIKDKIEEIKIEKEKAVFENKLDIIYIKTLAEKYLQDLYKKTNILISSVFDKESNDESYTVSCFDEFYYEDTSRNFNKYIFFTKQKKK